MAKLQQIKDEADKRKAILTDRYIKWYKEGFRRQHIINLLSQEYNMNEQYLMRVLKHKKLKCELTGND